MILYYPSSSGWWGHAFPVSKRDPLASAGQHSVPRVLELQQALRRFPTAHLAVEALPSRLLQACTALIPTARVSWAVTFIPMPMPKTVCMTNLHSNLVQLEVCITFSGRRMGMNIAAQCSQVPRAKARCMNRCCSLAGVVIVIKRLAEYGWKPHRDLLAQETLSRASIYWYVRETQRGTVSSNSRFQAALFQQYSANLSVIIVTTRYCLLCGSLQ